MLGRSTTAPPSGQSGQTVQTQAPGASPTRRFTDTAVGATSLRGGLHIRGSITGKDSVYIGGQVEGPIDVDGLLHLTETARVTGPISVEGAVIEGEFTGRILARGRVELCATARVRAEVHAATVAIAEGCFFDGHIHMGGGEADRGPTHFREKRRRRAGRRPAVSPDAPQTAAPAAERPAAAEPAAAPPMPAAAEPAAAAAPPASGPAPAVAPGDPASPAGQVTGAPAPGPPA